MKKQQKYYTEVSLLQATKGVILLKPAELTKIKDIAPENRPVIEDTHIYFICQRPRIRISTVSRRDSNGFVFTFTIFTSTGEISRNYTISDSNLPSDFKEVRTTDNGAYFCFSNGVTDVTPSLPPETLLKVIGEPFFELLNLEVLYIGQAYGNSGERSAADRLLSHSTLQEVLAAQAHTSWWMEPVILLFTYDDPRLISKMDGRNSPEITGDADRAHFKSVYDEPLSPDHLVTIAEASLIRYFRPYYNIHFKGHYPTSEQKHLRDAYRLDYNAIITEIDTEDICISTFSEHHKPSGHHIAQFDLHDPSERFSFFTIQ